MANSQLAEAIDVTSDGRQRILDAAVCWLEKHSEADLRMSSIADEADVTIALITHHFGSRDGLVVAAQRVRVAGAAAQDIDFMQEVLARPVTAADFRARLDMLMRSILDDACSARRFSRMAALAAAHGRDSLKPDLGLEISHVLSVVTDMVERAQLAGFVRNDVNPRAVASLIQAILLGFVLSDLDNERPDWDDIRTVVMHAFDSFLVTAT